MPRTGILSALAERYRKRQAAEAPSQTATLSALAEKYGSDKWGSHSYTRHYEYHFAKFRDCDIGFLEIGIGGYDDPAIGGASLRMWNDYFPKARVFALDIHEKRFRISDRVRMVQGSQTDAAILQAIERDAGGLDIVVDDGSHINEDVIASFNILFPLLRSGGLYVVEDTQTSYWPALGGSSVDPDSDRTIVGFFKGLIHGLNHNEIAGEHRPEMPYDEHVVAVSFYHNMIVIEKGDNTEPSNIPADHPLRRPGG
jgi:demethylmacrocin O-methyltransferase